MNKFTQRLFRSLLRSFVMMYIDDIEQKAVNYAVTRKKLPEDSARAYAKFARGFIEHWAVE